MPERTLHVVGSVSEPIPVGAFDLLPLQKRITGTPLGRPGAMTLMLDFRARHGIKLQIEVFPMSRVNDAVACVDARRARHRVVLENDFDRRSRRRLLGSRPPVNPRRSGKSCGGWIK